MAPAQEDFVGNDKHYKVLRKALSSNDMNIWNSFVSTMGPRFRADLRGMDLSGCRLAGARLAGARLDGACLDEADLTSADLTGASLVGATLRDAKFDQTKLRTPARIKVKVKAAPPDHPEQLDPETRRRLKIERAQVQAREFLEDRAKKEAAEERRRAQVKARNNPSPFSRDE